MRKEDLNKEQLIGALGASEMLCDSLKKENEQLRKRIEKLESGICGSGVMIPVEYHTCDGKLWCNTGAFDEVLCRLYKANERINDIEQKRVERGIETFKRIEAILKINDELKAENTALKQRIKDLEDIGNNYEPQFAPDDDISAFNYECVKQWTSKSNLKKKIAELQDQHQQDCIRINDLTTTVHVLAGLYSTLRKNVGMD